MRPHDNLCFLQDVPHLFKSVKKAVITNQIIYLPDDIVREGNLPTNVVKASHLKDLVNKDGKFELRAAPRLTDDALKPQHFATMRVSNARAVVSQRTSTDLQSLALETQDPSYITTGWFVKHINRWFDLMTSRCPQLALRKSNEEKYLDAISHLKKPLSCLNV